ncbi:hypothetical protein [Roseibium sp.]|uniref:hypothetical protein n=1 Tax=Roseibium sp. TaxID=1936156 RepID=UPI003A968BE8
MSEDVLARLSGNPFSPKFLAQVGIAALLLLASSFHLLFHLDNIPDISSLGAFTILIGTLFIFASITVSTVFPYMFWIGFGRLTDHLVVWIMFSQFCNKGFTRLLFAGLVGEFSKGYFIPEIFKRFRIGEENFITMSMRTSHIISDYKQYKPPFNEIIYLTASIQIVFTLNFLASIPFLCDVLMLSSAVTSLIASIILLIVYVFLTIASYIDALRVAYQYCMDISNDESLSESEIYTNIMKPKKTIESSTDSHQSA